MTALRWHRTLVFGFGVGEPNIHDPEICFASIDWCFHFPCFIQCVLKVFGAQLVLACLFSLQTHVQAILVLYTVAQRFETAL